MKYYRVTLFNPGPPINLEDTTVVYCQAEDPGDLLIVAMDNHSKPVKDYTEVTQEVFNANQ